MNMGDKIKQRRTELNMTQEQLADKLSVSRSTVANWESGRNYPDLQLIASIADVLGLSLDELLREDCEMIRKIAEDTKCRKKQSWKIRVLCILLAVALVAALIGAGQYISLSKIETELTQVYKATVEVESGWTHHTTEPAPASVQMFNYDDYELAIHFIKIDDVQMDLEFQTDQITRADCGKNYSAENRVQEKDPDVGGLHTYRTKCSWDTDNDGQWDYYSIATGIDVGHGVYIIDTHGFDDKDAREIWKKHKAIVKSFQMVESEDTNPYVYNKGQVGTLVFHLPYWDSRTYLKDENVVIYSGQNDDYFVLRAILADHKDMTAKNMADIVLQVPYYTSAELITQHDPVKTEVGSAVLADFHVTYHGGSGDIKILFILDDNRKIIGCFIEEVECNKDVYDEIIRSIDYSKAYQEQCDILWNSKLQVLDTAEDHGTALELVTAAGFGEYGNSYNTAFDAAGDGIIVTYKKPASKYDFTRETTLLLATIESLEYVKVVYGNGETYTNRADDFLSLRYGDNRKTLSKDKGLFERYYWETLWLVK